MLRQRVQKWDDSFAGSGRSPRATRGVNSLLRSGLGSIRQSRFWHVLLIIRHGIHLLLRPASWLRNYLGDRIALHVETVWPSITGTLSSRRLTGGWESLTLRHGATSVRLPIDAVRLSADRIVDSRRIVDFEIEYPLSFGVFRPERVRLTYKSRRSDIKKAISKDSHIARRLVRPIEIVSRGVKHVRLSKDGTSEPDFHGNVAIVSIFADQTRCIDTSLSFLDQLRNAGYLTIVVDTSEVPQNFDTTRTDLYVHRRNEGWDFASWFSVLGKWPEITSRAERLLLTNDSNYGPFSPLEKIISDGRSLGANVWGITDSWAIDYHLQSYFLEFDAQTLRSGALQDFIADFPFDVSKDEVVLNGEIGLTKFLQNRGFSLKALFPYEKIIDRLLADFKSMADSILELPENRLQLDLGRSEDIYELAFLLDVVDSIRMSVPLDPTLHLWETLLRVGGPFIKRKLVLSREGGFPGIERLPDLLSPSIQADAIFAEAPHRFIGRPI